MQWDDESSPAELADALANQQHEQADRLVAALRARIEGGGSLVPVAVACAVLGRLRAHCRFEPLRALCSALEEAGLDDPEVRRQLAQARIEEGHATEAIAGLRALVEELQLRHEAGEGSEDERARVAWELGEARGLLGRAYKQLYVDARPNKAELRVHDLGEARRHYGEAYEARLGDYLWHGINDVALHTHTERLRRGNARVCPAAAQAGAILELLAEREREQGALAPWDLATRAEALLAGGEAEAATEAVQAYLDHPDLDAFQIRSTTRQFRQLYLLDDEAPPGDRILKMMTARMAQLGGSGTSVELRPEMRENYERVFGDVRYKPLAWLARGIERAQGVARLGPSAYEGTGTGFLFDGGLLGEAYAETTLLLTNAHVCSTDAAVRRRYPWPCEPTALSATFLAARGDGEAVSLPVARALFTSPPPELDATLLVLEGRPPEGATAPVLADTVPEPGGEDARVNAIGHPQGLDVHVSLQDNKVVSLSSPYLHYRTPTDGGSSGSPIFNQAWELVALHHKGDSGRQANEGVLMGPLLEAMRRELA